MKLSELKPELESVKRENAKLKAQVERERSREDRAQVSADNHKIQILTQKVGLIFGALDSSFFRSLTGFVGDSIDEGKTGVTADV